MRSKLFALWLLAFSFVPELFAQTGISPPDAGLFNKAVACIKGSGRLARKPSALCGVRPQDSSPRETDGRYDGSAG